MDCGRAAGACAQRRRALRLHALGNVQAQVMSVRQALTARVAVVADAAAANDESTATMAWREALATSDECYPALPCRG